MVVRMNTDIDYIQQLTPGENCSETYSQNHFDDKSNGTDLGLNLKHKDSYSSPDEDIQLSLDLDLTNQCSVHSNIDPKLNKSRFEKSQHLIQQNTSTLAQTAVAVRAVSKKLSRRKVKWTDPKTILVVTKPGDKKLSLVARELVLWLLTCIKDENQSGMTVYVDGHLEKSKKFNLKTLLDSVATNHRSQLKFWTPELIAADPDQFDFVITLGGDGTVLYTSWLFQKVVPAVIPFHLGSLGFLTTFNFDQHEKFLEDALAEGVRINMRMRFSCTIYRFQDTADGKLKKHDHGTLLFDPKFSSCQEDEDNESNEFTNKAFKREATYQILNDLVVDRGPSPFMSYLKMYGDGEYLTTVQADGLTVATPTGSTAYSLAAGGSLVHPDVPALLITPICPHSLSFRPMLLPDSTVLFICLPFSARGTAFASFDGRARVELKRGDFILVEASKFPFPTVCASGSQSKDWFKSLNRCLLWNQRTLQKKLDNESEKEESDDEILDETAKSTNWL